MATTLSKDAAKALQADLIKLGYLPKGADDGSFGKASVRALTRFQRHAGRTYRWVGSSKTAADVVPANTFTAVRPGEADDTTLAEIKKWLTQGWVLPLGRFAFKKVGNFTLREDVADAWTAMASRIKALGGTIDGPYGDSKRGLGKATKVGASSFSFHIVGRAIDLNQAFANPSGRRYWIARDTADTGRDYWRIYCKTANQDGTQGKPFEKGSVSCQSFQPNDSFDIPKGYYIDLTEELTKDGVFERIPAHGGWDTNYNKTEWWHFQYAKDKQATFQDECELVGISESDLQKAGYSQSDMDRKPG
jgi:hypothetical protein